MWASVAANKMFAEESNLYVPISAENLICLRKLVHLPFANVVCQSHPDIICIPAFYYMLLDHLPNSRAPPV